MDGLKESVGRRLRALEVDAAAHRPRVDASDEDGCEEEYQQQDATGKSLVIAAYEETLRSLAKDVEQLRLFVGDTAQLDEWRSSVREMVTELTLSLSAHMTKHYWTSPTSIELARGVLDIVLNLCGCKSTLELLIGSHDSQTVSRDNHVTSPYTPIATRAEPTPLSSDISEYTNRHESPSSSTKDCKESEWKGQTREMVFTGGIIKSLLSLLRSRLTRETWKKQPNAKHALVWTLRQLKHPHLSPHLLSLLPPLLMLLDDHESYHKVLGLSAMTHLIKNTDPSELRWYGRSEVIYEAIKNMLYVREVEVIHSLHGCLVHLLPVLEGPHPMSVTMPRKPTRTDEVFRILLNNLDMESKIALRKAYVTHLSMYMETLGIYTARHVKQVLKVTAECLRYPDYSGEQTRVSALGALLTLMKHAWPRVPYHRDTLLKMLLRLVSDLCPEDDYIPDKPEVTRQLKLVSECMVMLQHCCGNLEDVYHSLQRDCVHRGLLSCLETSLASLEHEHSQTSFQKYTSKSN